MFLFSGSRCPYGAYCSNKRFETKAYAVAEVFLTENKGHGLKALAPISRYAELILIKLCSCRYSLQVHADSSLHYNKLYLVKYHTNI